MPAKVEFALEASVDTGGPRREFLHLLAKEVRDGDYFQAGNAGSFFVCNTSGYRVCKCIMINLVAMRLFVTFSGQPLQDSGLLCSNLHHPGWTRVPVFSCACVWLLEHRDMVASQNFCRKPPKPELEDSGQKCMLSCSHMV